MTKMSGDETAVLIWSIDDGSFVGQGGSSRKAGHKN